MSKAKKIIFILVTVALCCSVLLVPCMSVSAESPNVYKQYYQRPTADNYSGYIEVRFDGEDVVYTYFYRVLGTDYYQDFDIFGLVTATPNSLSIRFLNYNDSTEASINVVHGFMRTNDNYYNTYYDNSFEETLVINEWFPDNLTIANIKVYGFLGISPESSSNITSVSGWTVTYGSDSSVSDKLDKLISDIGKQNNNDIIANADKNASNIQSNADKNASNIQSNADKNTDKLIQAEKDQHDQEKQETQSSGNDSVDSLLGAMPGDTDGLLSSFGSLISCMSTTERKTKISFGSLKTPAVFGIPSYTLVEDMSLDLGRYEDENKTFKVILTLVRAFLTIALIIYCFKELYSTIQYVLTLRKGDGS